VEFGKSWRRKSRKWVRRYGHAYEWTGPILCAPKSGNAAAATFPCDVETIGDDKVVVPLFFYNIILLADHSEWKSIAFVLPNSDFKVPYHLDEFITSIDWIEHHTGISFMPNADRAVRKATKGVVSAMWQD
jgi:endonuclease G